MMRKDNRILTNLIAFESDLKKHAAALRRQSKLLRGTRFYPLLAKNLAHTESMRRLLDQMIQRAQSDKLSKKDLEALLKMAIQKEKSHRLHELLLRIAFWVGRIFYWFILNHHVN